MANLRSIDGGSEAARARAQLAELGGLGDDDSMRAMFLTGGLNALSSLVAEQDTVNISGNDLSCLLKIMADEAARVEARQSLDAARLFKRR